jgi:hypothetical protein
VDAGGVRLPHHLRRRHHYAAIPNLVVEVAPADRTSEINGMSHVVRTVGTAIGTQVATMLLASSTVSDV